MNIKRLLHTIYSRVRFGVLLVCNDKTYHKVIRRDPPYCFIAKYHRIKLASRRHAMAIATVIFF